MALFLLIAEGILFGVLGALVVAAVVFFATLVYVFWHRHETQDVLHHNASMIMGLSFIFASLAAVGVFCWLGLLISASLIANIVVVLGILVYRDFKMEDE